MVCSVRSNHSFITEQGVVDYLLTRSTKRKKTMQVSIGRNGSVEVVAPVSFSIRTIEDFLLYKSSWITGKIRLFKVRESFKIRNNSGYPELLYLGRVYPVLWRLSQEDWGRVDFNERGWTVDVPGRVEPDSHVNYVTDFLEKWFKSRAQSVIEERVAFHAERMGEALPQVRIRSPKRLWGSCHPIKRVVHFNWKLVMAPLEVLDYVVIHELSHLKVADHSKRYWSIVEKFSPDHGAHKQWLRLNMFRFELSLG